MFSFARRALLCLAAAAVKARDELAALGLDRRLASQKSPDIRAKENIRYELTQSQNHLTPTGLLMEGLSTFQNPARSKSELAIWHEARHISASRVTEAVNHRAIAE
jgi:hypothetical protein